LLMRILFQFFFNQDFGHGRDIASVFSRVTVLCSISILF